MGRDTVNVLLALICIVSLVLSGGFIGALVPGAAGELGGNEGDGGDGGDSPFTRPDGGDGSGDTGDASEPDTDSTDERTGDDPGNTSSEVGTSTAGGESEGGTSDDSSEDSGEAGQSGTGGGNDSGEASDGSGSETAPNQSVAIGGGSLQSSSESRIAGSIGSLSQRVLFTVQAAKPAYWREDTYVEYTGQGWRRPSETEPYEPPITDRTTGERLTQRITARVPMATVPSAWAPTRLGDRGEDARVSQFGDIQLTRPLPANETITVESRIRRPTPAELQAAVGPYPQAVTEYPAAIRSRYTRLPSSVPDRVAAKTDQVTANASTPYETAVAIEDWLESTKNYSLTVDRPDRNVAAEFVLEMDRGYCQYFATAMVVMLRTQGIPARYVTGYSTGQPVGSDTYVVRGMNAHAWVEVYFPDIGWVRFDPTPGSARLDVESAVVNQARVDGEPDVDTPESANEPYNHTEAGSPRETANESGPGGGATDQFGAIIGSQVGGSTGTNDRTRLSGRMDGLSTEVLFSVASPVRSYWREDAYVGYTGQGWNRSGTSRPYQTPVVDGEEGELVTQRITSLAPLGAVPAAWAPYRLGPETSQRARITETGGLPLSPPVPPNRTVRVTSRVKRHTPAQLRAAGQAYPADVRTTYTALPESVPDRVGTKTNEITADAETPYDAADAIERWLESEKSYALDIERPDGNMADSFIFEMDRGYCQYFATAMVVMLRTQDIPARYVSGFSTGQPTGDDTYLVREFNAHAWVEVYFPEVGWVRFDPTRGGPRFEFEQAALESARQRGDSNTDTDRSVDRSYEHDEAGSPKEYGEPSPSGDGASDEQDGGQGEQDQGDSSKDSSEPGDSSEDQPEEGDSNGDSSGQGGPNGDQSGQDGSSGDQSEQGGSDGGQSGQGDSSGDQSGQDDSSGDQSEQDQQDQQTPDPEPQPPLNVTLLEKPIPGASVTVSVTRGGAPVAGALVRFNGKPVGSTNRTGRLVATVPYAAELNVSVDSPEEDGATASVRSPQSSGQLPRLEGSLLPPSSARWYRLAGPVSRATASSLSNSTAAATTNHTTTYALPTSITLRTGEERVPGETVTLNVTIEGVPVRRANVTVDGRFVGRTNATGRFRLPLPFAETLRLGVTRGDTTGNRTIDLRTTIDIEPRAPPIPGRNATLVATIADQPFPGAALSVDGTRVGRTTIDGRARITTPYRRTLAVTVRRGELSRNVTVRTDGRLNLSVTGRRLPTRPVDLSVSIAGHPVENATVTLNNGTTVRTGPDGTARASLPIANTARIVAERGQLVASTRLTGLFYPVLGVLTGFVALVSAAVLVRRRGFGGDPSDLPGLLAVAIDWLLAQLVRAAAVVTTVVRTLRQRASRTRGTFHAAFRSLRERLRRPTVHRSFLTSLLDRAHAAVESIRTWLASLVAWMAHRGHPEPGGSDIEGEAQELASGGTAGADDGFDIESAWRWLASETAGETVGKSRGARTPSEIARQAIEAGYSSAAVDTLLRAFWDVTYGERPATAERRRAAERAYTRLRADQADDSTVDTGDRPNDTSDDREARGR